MALEQELDGINQNELFDSAFDWEPKYTNRFIMYMGDIPTYIIKAAARPSLTNGEVILDHINVERKLKGKTRWQDISITLYDPIVPSGAQSVMEWVRLHHESVTGRDGYSTQYKKDVRFNSLSPTGEIIEEWLLKGAFIADSNFGTMDWSTEESVQIELTLKYDYAVLEF
jgi:hypothetical protein